MQRLLMVPHLIPLRGCCRLLRVLRSTWEIVMEGVLKINRKTKQRAAAFMVSMPQNKRFIRIYSLALCNVPCILYFLSSQAQQAFYFLIGNRNCEQKINCNELQYLWSTVYYVLNSESWLRNLLLRNLRNLSFLIFRGRHQHERLSLQSRPFQSSEEQPHQWTQVPSDASSDARRSWKGRAGTHHILAHRWALLSCPWSEQVCRDCTPKTLLTE